MRGALCVSTATKRGTPAVAIQRPGARRLTDPARRTNRSGDPEPPPVPGAPRATLSRAILHGHLERHLSAPRRVAVVAAARERQGDAGLAPRSPRDAEFGTSERLARYDGRAADAQLRSRQLLSVA